jgi:hypothetical protein
MKTQIGSLLLNKQGNGISGNYQENQRSQRPPRFGNLNPKSRDFKSRLGGCETCVINDKLFSKTDLKTENDPQPDPSIQPKARGLLHMEREYFAYHIGRRNSGLEHLISSMQPKKYSED